MFFKYFFRRTLNKSSGQDNQSKAFKEAINPHIEKRKTPVALSELMRSQCPISA